MSYRTAMLVAFVALMCGRGFCGDKKDEDGFVPLFNGKNFDGWTIMGKTEGWAIKDGVIHSDGGQGGQWLRTKKKYSNFILKVEWKVSKGGNSGVFIRSGTDLALSPVAQRLVTGYEVQISNARRDDSHCTGSLYGFVAVKPRPDESADKWHTFEIRCQGPRVTVKSDGIKCIDFDQSTNAITKKKPLKGYIGLQDSHSPKGHYIEYRNVRIKPLKSERSSSVDKKRGLSSQSTLEAPIHNDRFVSLFPVRNPVAALSEKPSENRVATSFRGLADSTPPKLAWNATTVKEHRAWRTGFRDKMLEVLGRMPERVPLEVKWIEKKRFDKFTRHKIYIQTEKTFWCPVYYFVPHEIKKRTPAIVCLHGHDGVVPYLGEGRKPGEARPVLSRDFARFFAEHGYVTALPIVRGWNETAGYQDPYGGSPKRSCQNVTMNSLLLGMSPAGLRCWDAMRVIDFLETQKKVDTKRIGIAGLSGGGTLSLYLPILDDRVKLVMMAGVFSSYRNSFFAMNHCICNCLPGVMQYGEMSDVVALHAPRPVLLINGQRDKSAPIADARQGLGKLKRVYTLLGVPKRIEADFFDGPHEWSNGKTLEFLSKHFGK